MKSIWLISYQLDGVAAGPSIRFQRYAPLFQKQGYRLTFVTKHIGQNLPEYESRAHFDIIRIKANSKVLHHTFFIFKALLLALQNRNQVQAVLTFSITTLSLWLMPFYRLFKLPIFYINTMALNHEFIRKKTWWAKLYNWVHVWLYTQLYKSLNAIITSTEHLQTHFAIHGLPTTKFRKIYNGVNTSLFHPIYEEEQKRIRQQLNLHPTKKIFLFVGLKTERKGLWDLLDAWKAWEDAPNCQLVLIGDDKPSSNSVSFNHFWESYKQNLDPNSDAIINRNNQTNIADYFKVCNAFVFLSHKEGMPNVLLEAMACGIPTIVTAFEGFSNDYGSDQKEYLMVQRNRDSILNAFRFIYNQPQTALTIGKQASQKMIQNFDINNSIMQYINLFTVRK